MEEDSGLQEELELLEAIYLEDLSVERSDSDVSRVRVQINPATGDNADEKYVCLTLEFNLTDGYPEEVPEMVIRNPRGLADEHVMKLRQDLRALAEERAGMPMLYELIELGKESLTESNVPHGQCVICLEVLALGEVFTKTECYHYFHSACLLRYVQHFHQDMEREREEIRQHKHMTLEKKDVVCPVCREPIEADLDTLQSQAPPTEPDPVTIVVSTEIRSLQRKMAALYAQQQAKGGIIDVEAERNKFLLPSEDASSTSNDPVSHPAPLHLFNQTQLPVNMSSASQARGKDRGRPHQGKNTERSGKDRGEKSDSRNAYHKDNRHRERRGHGHERNRDEKGRPDLVRQYDRNYRKEPERRAEPVNGAGSEGYDMGRTETAYNKGRTETSYDKGRTETSYNKGRTETAYNKGRTETACDNGRTETVYNKGRTETAYDKGRTETAYGKRRTETAYDKGRTETSYNKGRTETAYDKGRTETTHGRSTHDVASDDVRENTQVQQRPRRGGKQSVGGHTHGSEVQQEKVWREGPNGEVLDGRVSQDRRSAGGDRRWDQRRHQHQEPHGGPSNGETKESLESEMRDRHGHSDRPAPRREGRRWSGRGRGRNFHDGHSSNPPGPADQKQTDLHFNTRKDFDSNHSFDNSSRGGHRHNHPNESEVRDDHYDQDFKYGARPESGNDRRTHTRPHTRGKSNHDRRPYVDRDCDSREQSYTSKPLPPPGIRETCKRPPGFPVGSAANSRPRAPPGFDEGR